MRQHNVPGLGALVESFAATLPFLSVLNFWAIITVLYATAQPYLLQYTPWITLWSFVGGLTLTGVIIMIIIYKFVLPSVWSFRGRQMFDRDSQVVERLGVIEAILTGSSEETKSKVPDRLDKIEALLEKLVDDERVREAIKEKRKRKRKGVDK